MSHMRGAIRKTIESIQETVVVICTNQTCMHRTRQGHLEAMIRLTNSTTLLAFHVLLMQQRTPCALVLAILP